MTPRFRPTVWPPGTVDVPPVPRSRLTLKNGIVSSKATAEAVDLPEELYLRGLLALDLDSDDEVFAFMAEYGVVLHELHKLFGLWLPDEVRQASQEATVQTFSIEVSRWTLRYLRILVRHWIAAVEDADISAAWAAEGLKIGNEQATWHGWSNLLSSFLTPFHVRVQVVVPGAEQPPPPWVTLDQALALQLSNAISEDLPLRRCANETCGRAYVRQQGRARYAADNRSLHHTTGTRYCSHNCAKAQSERERRRRRAEDGKPANGGGSRVTVSEHPAGLRGVQQGLPRESGADRGKS